MSRKLRAILTCALLADGSASLFAHDFWIEPSDFRPAVGSKIDVALRVGMNFEGEPVVRKPERIEKFVLIGPASETPIDGEAGKDPAGSVSVDGHGLHVIGFRSNHSFIELKSEDFEAYLKEEGLERIIELRKQRGDSDKSAREFYSRCAKALIAGGGNATGAFDRGLGFTLEFFPLNNPLTLKPGEELKIRLVFDHRPLPGAYVTAIRKGDPKGAVSAMTDLIGMASFKINQSGVWMIKTVHMIPASDSEKADWESCWATLTFEVKGESDGK